jgi:hypothetical protein
MNRATLGLLLTAISSTGLQTWGFYEIKKKKRLIIELILLSQLDRLLVV